MVDVRSVESTSWLQRLVHEATGEPSAERLDAVIGLVASAIDVPVAALWDGGRSAEPEPTMVAAYVAPEGQTATGASSCASGSVALPVTYAGGREGKLTLPATTALEAGQFDVLIDLLQVLPELHEVIRDRQSLAIVRRCDEILRDAEHESADEPLTPDRLGAHFELVCQAIAETLGCAEVFISLREPGADEGTGSLVARWRVPSEPARPADGRLSSDGSRSAALNLSEVFDLVVPVATGARHWGEIGCRRPAGPLARITDADLPVLKPVAAQVARSWNSWLQRRVISAEIASWRQLASAVTRFNRLLAGELKRREPADDRVHREALEIVRSVVPACTGADVRRPEGPGPAASLPVAHASGFAHPAQFDGTVRSTRGGLAATVYATRLQRTVLNHDLIRTECLDPDATWLVTTPISAGDRTFGVLDASGASLTVPPNVAQVCEIVSDQLGLYEHLRQTLQHLRDTRGRLEATMRSQAEALEDLEHQLVSPLLAATSRIERVLHRERFDLRTTSQLHAIRGLCRKSSRVAMAAGVFATLSQGRMPSPKLELHSADELVRLLIAAADDAQLLGNPRRGITFEVDRESVRSLGRWLVNLDRTFLEQCVGNLLDNAAKYSFPNTQVVIGGELADETYAINVSSTGLALEPEEAELTLQRNWRGALARSASGEGSGLGLWIVDKLMQSMNASVRVIPTAESTTVRLAMPLRGFGRR